MDGVSTTPATDWAEFHQVGRWLRTHPFRAATARTAPPHSYTLRRRDWRGDDAAFGWTVAQIRARGYRARFAARVFTYLDVNTDQYWTRDASPATVRIHRASRIPWAPYDAIAETYDTLFHDPASLAENAAVFAACGDLHDQDVLDIGCGTGLACGAVTVARYLGIDPAPRMLARLHARVPEARTLCTRLAAFVPDTDAPPQYDVVLALFGVGSYLSDRELGRIPTLVRPGGRAYVMFYAPHYVPVTHVVTGVHAPYEGWAPDRMPGTPTTIGHHVLVTYTAPDHPTGKG